jgi:hypothetical protein
MRTCDCGWIAEWDLGKELYIVHARIGDSEPPPGTRRCEDVEGCPQAPAAFALLRRTIQLFPKPYPGEPPARYLYRILIP